MKAILILMFLAIYIYGQTSVELEKNSKRKAERIWELAVEAKGGRKKMLTIQNLVISSTGKFQLGLFKKFTNRNESFYVFPNKMWAWEDYRPSVFGLTMRMYNWETGKKYVFDPREEIDALKPIEQVDVNRAKDNNGNVIWTGLVMYILESKWWKPIPEAVKFGKIKGHKVHIIQTTLYEKRVDFFLNQTNHLPERIVFHNFNKITKITDTHTVDLSDYIEIDGFKMPAKLKESDGNKYDLTYRFNVEYNEHIFKNPPSYEAGYEAWKIK